MGCRLLTQLVSGKWGPLAKRFLVSLATLHTHFGRSDFPGSFGGTGASGTEYSIAFATHVLVPRTGHLIVFIVTFKFIIIYYNKSYT